jgi:carboxymethylenebutenolidase
MAERVKFASKSGKDASGEIVLPKGDGKAPAVVLIQEWWGVNDHIRSLLERLAAAGFVALAPDLYHGTITKDAAEAAKLMTDLDGAGAMDEIAGAVALLAKHPRSSGKVGVIGFCMGGAFSFRSSVGIPELKAAVPFYGISDAADYSKVKMPIQAHVGAKDDWVTPEKAAAVKKTVDAAGGSMELHVYDAGHAFVNDTRPEAYAPDAAKVAWGRAMEFLHKHLD